MKVTVTQKAPGVVELRVGTHNMTLNCPILLKWLLTKSQFTMKNALQQECVFNVHDNWCDIQLEGIWVRVYKQELIAVLEECEHAGENDNLHKELRTVDKNFAVLV